ncbi:carbon-phosphorus lyase complex subunit PhnI [Pseudonocardia zijingensis]|jgi:alpha-D-ribose 1-methylphosphonate 5-triphosphate synthase subunit PhnI|uniref:Carbon-phosphorus lyase complex subunit PhnI n=1 Tax=Pseudonocardia zijingensis TaxID=153376 RepID=A0ABP3YVA4_9PSEU
MGYSGARGGLEAILAAERLVRDARDHAPAPWASTEQITARFRLAVDRVQGEAGLYHEPTAADAFRQAEGDTLEAAHLVRAHRSTLPRLAVSEPVDPDEMVVLRRIVPAHRTPDGPQLLGRTTDYTGRMLEREPSPTGRTAPSSDRAVPTGRSSGAAQRQPGRFSAFLRSQDLLVEHTPADTAPFDVTRRPARPPAPRSAVLASMARAETGALVGLWYRSILGPDGDIHEVTLGEVRHGHLPLSVRHPHTGNPVRIGRFRATETEAIEDLDGADEDRTRFDVGYGLCFGHNERKAIAMANLDIACRRFGRTGPLEQLLLLTTDGLDSAGFLEHLKLPHYVTFRSMVERKQAVRATGVATEPPGRDCR